MQVLGVALFTLVFFVGCGGGSKVSNKERVYPIKATLTMDGQPIGPIFLVQLHSTSLSGPQVSGEADNKGNLKFTTNRVGDGAPVGEYKLIIPKDPLGRAVKPVPDVYRQVGTTPLTYKVEAKKNEFTVALDSKAELSESAMADPTMAKKTKVPPHKNAKPPVLPPVPSVDPKLVR